MKFFVVARDIDSVCDVIALLAAEPAASADHLKALAVEAARARAVDGDPRTVSPAFAAAAAAATAAATQQNVLLFCNTIKLFWSRLYHLQATKRSRQAGTKYRMDCAPLTHQCPRHRRLAERARESRS
jgi:hypothetical protein